MLEKIRPKDLSINPFTLISREWMLISVGTEQKHNMMTASQGTLGVFWGRNVTSVYTRPQRYTLELVSEQEYCVLSFFEGSCRKALAYCDAHSDHDVDKAKKSGLTSAFDAGASCFQEAKLVLICRKLHCQKLDPIGFIDPALNGRWYPEKGYYRIFQGETVKVL